MSIARRVARAAIAGLLLGASGCDKRDAPEAAASAEPTQAPAAAAAPSTAASVRAPLASASAREDCCMGKNPCRGKGGCAVPESHACKGRNACAGQGGCRAHCPR